MRQTLLWLTAAVIAAGVVVLGFVVLRPTPAAPLTDREQVEAQARGYLEDVGNGEFLSAVDRMCLSRPSIKRAPATVIPRSTATSTATVELPIRMSAEINSVQIVGSTATVDADLVVLETRRPVPLTLRREASGWCIVKGIGEK